MLMTSKSWFRHKKEAIGELEIKNKINQRGYILDLARIGYLIVS